MAGSASERAVRARSWAEMPVVTPAKAGVEKVTRGRTRLQGQLPVLRSVSIRTLGQSRVVRGLNKLTNGGVAGDGVGSLVLLLVVGNHHRNLEPIQALAGKADADVATAPTRNLGKPKS